MSFYANPNKWTTREEKLKAKIKKNMVMPGTERINWDKAINSWTQYYNNGIITLNINLFFTDRTQQIQYIKTRREIYYGWRYGYT